MIQQKLINLRKKTGLTQEQMAKSIAMEQTTYSRKELGKSSITNDEWYYNL
jgi:DNA-binding XRE family transcriptional regulator